MQKPYKICVYAICKNEEAFVERWMAAVKEADLVVVLDTGSTDNTAARLRELGAQVHEKSISPWRFDAARNAAMDCIPEEYDICVSNDLDEIFEPGWRKKLEAAWSADVTRARYTFVWSHNADGSPCKCFNMEKIHGRKGFRWVHPVHEVLEYRGEIPDKTVHIPDMILHHYPDLSKPRSQYLPLLELSAQENPGDDRTAFWLGREYFYYGEYQKCVAALERYLQMPAARWDEERSAAMRFIAKSHAALGDYAAQRSWLLRAAAEAPRVREPYLELAKLGYRENDWALTYWAAREGLRITEKSGSYLLEPEAWGGALYDYGAIAAYRLGNDDAAFEWARAACALAPDDLRLRQNLALIRRGREEKRANEAL